MNLLRAIKTLIRRREHLRKRTEGRDPIECSYDRAEVAALDAVLELIGTERKDNANE